MAGEEYRVTIRWGTGMADFKIISADDHVFEPPDLFTSRMDDKYRDRAPRVVRSDGADWWVCGDRRLMNVTTGSQPGVRLEDPRELTLKDTYENVRPGGYDPDERLKDMDTDGVEVSINYPNVGLLLYTVPDSDLLTAAFSVYNDWLGEFCHAHPKRLKAIAMLNVEDIDQAIKEMRRCADMGFAGAMITVYPHEEHNYFSLEYEPLWASAQDLEMPISLHVATNRPGPGQEQGFGTPGVTAAFIGSVDHWMRMSLSHIIYAGVFERYPKLMVGSIEAALSWIPHFLDRLDYMYTQRPLRPGWYKITGSMLPSEYFHRNVFVGFQEDALGIKWRDIIGVDKLQWGSDYPHQESTWPHSRRILDRVLADCTGEEKAKIAGGNAARVYHLA